MATPNLTKPNPELERMVNATIPGMAHWAGSGPPGATCGKCKNWRSLGDDDSGKIKFNRCEKYFQLIGKVGPEPIPKGTAACRYFAPGRILLG